jgi:hypothetical protein
MMEREAESLTTEGLVKPVPNIPPASNGIQRSAKDWFLKVARKVLPYTHAGLNMDLQIAIKEKYLSD